MTCPRCGKPEGLCVCAAIQPIQTRLQVLILQHPQEKVEPLATAPLLEAALPGAHRAVGLSWPNIRRALKREAADPQRWGVLYLGSAEIPPGRTGVFAVDRKGHALRDQQAALAGLEGIIALDGTWSQAKALWWRNAWLLKCRRLVLRPDFRSHYGALRREPRPDSLSTLEAVGYALATLEDDPTILARLLVPFDALLERYRRRRPARPAGPPG